MLQSKFLPQLLPPTDKLKINWRVLVEFSTKLNKIKWVKLIKRKVDVYFADTFTQSDTDPQREEQELNLGCQITVTAAQIISSLQLKGKKITSETSVEYFTLLDEHSLWSPGARTWKVD